MSPLISICIPAYKNSGYLKILFNSIKNQTYKNFEVVVTDDSPNDDVEFLCKEFESYFEIKYYKNKTVKGSPANWNEAINNASGSWIKLMHDDDWFATDEALQIYSEIISSNKEFDFLFSAYNDYENNVYKKTKKLKKSILKKVTVNPMYLFRSNYIGNPSAILIKKNSKFFYDENLKWVVDFEFYIRCLKEMKVYYCPEILINVGYNRDQITKEVFRNIKVEIPENIYILNKFGVEILRNIIVYDYFWRLFRNLNIRKIETVLLNLDGNELNKSVIEMIKFQVKLPIKFLKIGIFSKIFMSISYLKYRMFFR